MFNYINGLVFFYFIDDATMNFDLHVYYTTIAENMDLYMPRCYKKICKEVFVER